MDPNETLRLAHKAWAEGRDREAAGLYALYAAFMYAPEALSEIA